MQYSKRNQHIRSMVMIAMFAAMAYVVMVAIHIKVSFLTMDVKDAVITLCGLCFGPAASALLSILVPLLELVTVSDTGVYGLIMNMLGSVSFSLTATVIYRYKKTFGGAILGLLSGVVMMTGVMLLANLYITPYYMHVPKGTVREMIPTLFLPFNLLKGAINAGVVLLLYKHLATFLRRIGVLDAPQEKTAKHLSRRTLFVTVLAVVLILGAGILIFTALDGKIVFGS